MDQSPTEQIADCFTVLRGSLDSAEANLTALLRTADANATKFDELQNSVVEAEAELKAELKAKLKAEAFAEKLQTKLEDKRSAVKTLAAQILDAKADLADKDDYITKLESNDGVETRFVPWRACPARSSGDGWDLLAPTKVRKREPERSDFNASTDDNLTTPSPLPTSDDEAAAPVRGHMRHNPAQDYVVETPSEEEDLKPSDPENLWNTPKSPR